MDNKKESPKPKAMTFAEKLDLILLRLKLIENATAATAEMMMGIRADLEIILEADRAENRKARNELRGRSPR